MRAVGDGDWRSGASVAEVLRRRRAPVGRGGEKVGQDAGTSRAHRGYQGGEHHESALARARARRGAVPRPAVLVQDGQPRFRNQKGTGEVRQGARPRRRARQEPHRLRRGQRRRASARRGGRDGPEPQGPGRRRSRCASDTAVRRRVRARQVSGPGRVQGLRAAMRRTVLRAPGGRGSRRRGDQTVAIRALVHRPTRGGGGETGEGAGGGVGTAQGVPGGSGARGAARRERRRSHRVHLGAR